MGNTGSTVDFTNDVPSLFFFKLRENIGEGAYGKVRVVKHRETKQLYALKYCDKELIVQQRSVSCMLAERDILEEIRHEYIVNLRYAFQDDEACFFVLDLMMGGDLRQHLRHEKRFKEFVVRMWFAELSSAVSFLHGKRIAHCDIKPDNILLDAKGHAHLTDFNVSVRFKDNSRIKGFAGTSAYAPPEMFGDRGYTQACDWWSMGVLTFELLFGVKPFTGINIYHGPDRNKDEERAYAASLSWQTAQQQLPADWRQICSEDGVNVLSQLLEADKLNRLGCGLAPGAHEMAALHAQPWLNTLDFAAIGRKELAVGFIPDRANAVDPIHAISEDVVSSNPLRARKWDPNQDTRNMSPDMRALHENFLPYDWERPEKWSKRALVPAPPKPVAQLPRQKSAESASTKSSRSRRTSESSPAPMTPVMDSAHPPPVPSIVRPSVEHARSLGRSPSVGRRSSDKPKVRPIEVGSAPPASDWYTSSR